MVIKYKIFFWAFLFLFPLINTSCRVNYSFTGASIPPGIKSIQIDNFPNNALLVNPTLSQELTDALRNKFQSQTSLVLVNQGGDLVITGEITDYNTKPTAIQSTDIAALNRLTITVKVSFVNNFDKNQSFQNQIFSRYLDYPSTQDLVSVQDILVKEINNYLIEDIFNKTVVNW
ncbi:MAG TPA: LptE family protein [Bacteroidales bacterium]|nr:LptE family protein [Bacteroidales bacterium]HQO07714.1 LptE family protein [Bacteroidales bacterium]HQP53573.1 LptE family protein [Bacteroidales bacterium]